MRYCSTWLRSLLCYIKKFVIEEFVIKVLHCIYVCTCNLYTTNSELLPMLDWSAEDFSQCLCMQTAHF